jgi:hypothetical protein
MDLIMPPSVSSAMGFNGFSGTNLVKSSVNGKPLDVQAATRHERLMPDRGHEKTCTGE